MCSDIDSAPRGFYSTYESYKTCSPTTVSLLPDINVPPKRRELSELRCLTMRTPVRFNVRDSRTASVIRCCYLRTDTRNCRRAGNPSQSLSTTAAIQCGRHPTSFFHFAKLLLQRHSVGPHPTIPVEGDVFIARRTITVCEQKRHM
jgi:hypothetical protein